MPTFQRGDVVKVPFPYADRATRQRRPAVVISGADLAHRHGLLWVMMITSAENRHRDGDLVIASLAAAGLSAPSVIRTTKIATLDARDAERIGKVKGLLLSEAVALVRRQIEDGAD